MAQALDELLQNPAIWRAGQLPRMERCGIATGFPLLDGVLPGGGWPAGALTEILTDGLGMGEVSLLLSALSQASIQERGILWVAAPYLPYAPALQTAGVNPSKCLVARATSPRDAFWVVEQGLKSGACGAVLAWLEQKGAKFSFSMLQRLQAAADAGDAMCFLFRPVSAASGASPAHLRIRVAARQDALDVWILKRRGSPVSASLRFVVRGGDWPSGRSKVPDVGCGGVVLPFASPAVVGRSVVIANVHSFGEELAI